MRQRPPSGSPDDSAWAAVASLPHPPPETGKGRLPRDNRPSCHPNSANAWGTPDRLQGMETPQRPGPGRATRHGHRRRPRRIRWRRWWTGRPGRSRRSRHRFGEVPTRARGDNRGAGETQTHSKHEDGRRHHGSACLSSGGLVSAMYLSIRCRASPRGRTHGARCGALRVADDCMDHCVQKMDEV